MLRCPECDTDLVEVRVYSQCYQVGTLEGDKIVEYSGVEEVLETLSIECAECGAEITNLIQEN